LTSERVERRLAAVLAMDVAGYSRLMGIDEEGTLASPPPTSAIRRFGPAAGVHHALKQCGGLRRERSNKRFDAWDVWVPGRRIPSIASEISWPN
jgi:hypothetical protein